MTSDAHKPDVIPGYEGGYVFACDCGWKSATHPDKVAAGGEWAKHFFEVNPVKQTFPPNRSYTFGSICSGIGGAEVAFGRLGWHCAFMSEIADFPRAVLSHHYPDTPLYGDFREIKADGSTLDILVGGPPCQDFSIAGKRAGMAGSRGSLTLAYVELVERLRPRWLIYENVPGLLSSNGGRDFGAFVGALGEIGYCFAWRVFDAQYFGVPQRRSRIYLVGYLGTAWQRPGAVLFDPDCLSRHHKKVARSQEVPDVALCVTARFGSGRNDPTAETYLVESAAGEIAHTLRGEGFDASEDGTGRGTPLVAVSGTLGTEVNPTRDARCKDGPIRNQLAGAVLTRTVLGEAVAWHHEIAPCVTSNYGKQPDSSNTSAGPNLIAFCNAAGDTGLSVSNKTAPPITTRHGDPGMIAFSMKDYGGDEGVPSIEASVGLANAVRAADGGSSRDFVSDGWRVRRLMPIETERLQAFPDNHTLVPVRTTKKGKVIMAADGPRYKGCGNAFATVVMEEIGRRIEFVDTVAAQESAA